MAVQTAPNHDEAAGAWLVCWPLAAGGTFEDHVDRVEDELALVAAHGEDALDAEDVLAALLELRGHPRVEAVELELGRSEAHAVHAQGVRQEGGWQEGGRRRSLVRLNSSGRGRGRGWPPQLRQSLEGLAALEGMLPEQLVQGRVRAAAREDARGGVDGARGGGDGGLLLGGGEVNLARRQGGSEASSGQAGRGGPRRGPPC